MVKKLMLAVAMVALLAAPSFAAVQNVKIGGELKTTSVMRNNVQNVATVGGNQNDILSQAGITVAADLTDNVSTTLKLVNERVWGTYSAGTATSNVDLDTAYVTMKELFYAPLSVTVGRQPLAYGNKLVIGDGDATSNLAAASALRDLTGGVNFDAIKAVLAYDPLTVDVFAARINNGGARFGETIGATHDNANLYGVNANYKMGDKMSTVVEAYTFADINDNAVTPTYKKQTTTYTPGLRVSTNPIEGLNVQLEGAWQTGRIIDTADNSIENRNAFAFQSMVNYALPVMKDMKPVLGAEYKYLSGNSDYDSVTGNSTKTTAWSAPYSSQDVGRIFYSKGIAASNLQLAALSLEISPLKDLTAKATINGLWKAQKAAYAAGVDNSSLYYGTEADLDLTYAYTEDVKFGVSAGYLTSGTEATNNGLNNVGNASQLLSSVSVLF